MTDTAADILHWAVPLGAATIFIAAVVGSEAVRRRRLRRAAAEPLPAAWMKVLQENVPIYRRLPPELKAELPPHIKVFLAERRFEGCGGLEMTDTVRITVAAQACVLILGRKQTYSKLLESILVYPDRYVVPTPKYIGGGQIVTPEVRLGESWQHTAVVLAWDDVPRGPVDVRTGRNLVLHEFAHQLDTADGFADGVPLMDRRADYEAWVRVLGARYEELVQAVEEQQAREKRGEWGGGEEGQGPPAGGQEVLDPYGATNAAEFFAVATEAFFEKPDDLARELPDLYDELRKYYRLDPAAWARG